MPSVFAKAAKASFDRSDPAHNDTAVKKVKSPPAKSPDSQSETYSKYNYMFSTTIQVELVGNFDKHSRIGGAPQTGVICSNLIPYPTADNPTGSKYIVHNNI